MRMAHGTSINLEEINKYMVFYFNKYIDKGNVIQQHLITNSLKWDEKRQIYCTSLGRSENLRLVFGLLNMTGS